MLRASTGVLGSPLSLFTVEKLVSRILMCVKVKAKSTRP